ncbi:iron-containing redox enzyme family protein [Nocardioides sp.]|uniref:iron-containing redox enzyme family protein n=1 Tax=Nocardioides sp. TaxID=35761 RepID=UPI002ED09E11
MHIPSPRGKLSACVAEVLRQQQVGPIDASFAESDEDAALSLWILHELSYSGFADVDDGLEWDIGLVTLRLELEAALEAQLRDRFPGPPEPSDDLVAAFFGYVETHDGPSLAGHVHTDGTDEQVLELLRWRSVYHLKETDPSAFVLARLPRPARAALAELLYDEYGAGRPERLHSHLFAEAMRSVGLDPERGYVDDVPLEVLELNNAVTMFGLHRRLRGAAMGHLAAFECTSSVPSRRLVRGLQRLGFPPPVIDYYEEHVLADAVHEQVAVRDIVSPLVTEDPRQLEDVFFGAFTCLDQEARVARVLLDRWGVAA